MSQKDRIIVVSNTVVFFHSECQDGFGAAWAAHCHFGDAAKYIPISYAEPIPSISSDVDVWFLDFCPRAHYLVTLLDRGHRVFVLDHHLSTKEIIDSIHSPNLTTVFDVEHSGAVIAWKYFYPKLKVPILLRLIEDRDLWQWNLADTEAVTEALDAMEWSFAIWDRLHGYDSEIATLAQAGHLLVRFKHRAIERIVKRASFEVIGGHTVPVVNSDSYVSDVGNALCKEHPSRPFGAVWYQLRDGRKKWSLRSIGEFNVADVAKLYGGGGHKNAAGFVQ